MAEALLVQMLEWIGEGRPYAEVMGAWRTSCPRMPVWEEAVDRGLVRREAGAMVRVTEAGRAAIADHRASENAALAGEGRTDEAAGALALVRRFAAALDREDYRDAGACLGEGCVYEIRGGCIAGPGAIVASYRGNGEAARRFDAIEYGSEVRPGESESAGWLVIAFWDRITHGGRVHVHRCEQWVRVEGEGSAARIARIEHRDLAGEREALAAFESAAGAARPDRGGEGG